MRAASTASRSCSALGTGETGPAGGLPARACPTRCTRSATREARQELQAAGPVASASASVRACSRSRVPRDPTVVATASTVAGSSRSRRVAVSTSSRWWRTSRASTSASARPKPSRVATSRAITSPAAQWSPGQPLPMSCSRAAISSRSGRSTRRVRPAARTAVSTRWRSTVQRCTALRCGRQRTRSQSGSRRVISPSASSASQTGTVDSPAPSRVTSCSRASAGQGTGQRAVPPRPARRTACSESGSPAWAAAAAARSGSTGSALGFRGCGPAPPRRPARRRPRRAGCGRPSGRGRGRRCPAGRACGGGRPGSAVPAPPRAR